MKRSVAIVGQTPPFLRWAISYTCPLRVVDPERVAESSFRQLRAIRELSLAMQEHRCIDGICLHPDAASQDVASARGFPAAEVADPMGGVDFVQSCCADCRANAGAATSAGTWAGCFGWLSTDLRFRSDDIAQGRLPLANEFEKCPRDSQLIDLVEAAVAKLDCHDEWEGVFPAAGWAWYRFWQCPVPNPEQLQNMERVFQQVQDDLESIYGKHSPPDLTRFVDAIRTCQTHSLELHVELVPAGRSDGLTWEIEAHCQDCKYGLADLLNCVNCPTCGGQNIDRCRRRSKVLGIRPYVHLKRILGSDRTRKLLKKYKQRKT